MRKSGLKGFLKLVLFVLLIGGGYFAFTERQSIIDWWRLQNYKPQAEIAALADATTMSGKGRDLFYASHPELNDAAQFNANCTDTGEESLVLGCYHMQRIFLYNIGDPRLSGVKEVTAAHEMLHAAYERLAGGEKERLNGMLQNQLDQIENDRLDGLIALYNQHEPGQLLNEMHSILGTEFRNLSPELEQYYARYFDDRLKVVGFAEAYESVFTESKSRIADYDRQLADIKQRIDTSYALLDERKAAIDRQSAQLNALRSDPQAYNNAVPEFNTQVRSFNELVIQTRDLINEYNNIVQQRNSEAAAQADLYNSLDSQYEPVPTN